MALCDSKWESGRCSQYCWWSSMNVEERRHYSPTIQNKCTCCLSGEWTGKTGGELEDVSY